MGGRCCGVDLQRWAVLWLFLGDVCVLGGRMLEIFGVLDLNTIEWDFLISSNIEKTSTQTRVGSRIWIWNLPPIESSLMTKFHSLGGMSNLPQKDQER